MSERRYNNLIMSNLLFKTEEMTRKRKSVAHPQ
nr:MAG TPA_asm: hypothetical protein [Bacteriophage sp.]